jgi:hypothetical protein
MKKTLSVFLLLTLLILSACTAQGTTTKAPVFTTEAPSPTVPNTPVAATPTTAAQPGDSKSYSNSAFGLGFQYPSTWFGPDESVSGETLRVEVGSDTVYPYGNPPETPPEVTNSYHVVTQYTKNNQNPFWKDTYQSLQNLKDGESLSGVRNLIIRVKEVDLGRFKGFEYIFTLPESAQTDHVYGREVMFFDEQTNDLLTITGQPNNVEVNNGANWRDVFRSIDEANMANFHQIVDSMTVN